MTSLSRVEGIADVASHTFHLDAPGTLGALGRLLAEVPIYGLVSGDLAEAMDAVLEYAGDGVKFP